jgi:hypothetical protein
LDNPPVEVVESERYTNQKAMLGSPEFMDEIQTTFDLILARDPYFGDGVPTRRHYFVFQTTSYPPRIPSYRILYYYDPDAVPRQVILMAIARMPFSEDY